MGVWTIAGTGTGNSTGTYIWSSWCAGTAATCTVDFPLSTTNATWTAWTTAPVTNVTYSISDGVWKLWSNSGTNWMVRQAQDSAETDAQRAERAEGERQEWQRRAAEAEARRVEAEARAAEAEARAEELLKRVLSDEQCREYEADKTFHVVAESGRRYRVRYGRHGNVDEIDESGKPINRFCIHTETACPNPDNMLAQKLLLETNEKRFREIANVTRVAG